MTMKKLKQLLSMLLAFTLVIINVLPASAAEVSAEEETGEATALIDVQDIEITSGTVYDLSSNENASAVYALTAGTIFVEFESSSTQQYQSLFSVSNPTTDEDNMYRHFHVYITPAGTLGMELRNTDSEFKYTIHQWKKSPGWHSYDFAALSWKRNHHRRNHSVWCIPRRF